MAHLKIYNLTKEYVRSRLRYLPKKGILIWKPLPELTAVERRWNTKHAGTVAGSVVRGGYRLIYIDGIQYPAHVVIYLGMTGIYPTKHIDHKDGNGNNNRWKNLRHAEYSENQWNSKKRKDNSTGYKGVSETKWGSFIAYLSVKGKRLHLGSFETAELAYQERMKNAELLHGEFAR